MTSDDRITGRPAGARRRAAEAAVPDPRPGEKGEAETREPYDLPFPDTRPDRPDYVIVVGQLRGWQPGRPPSLIQILETAPASSREPEPDREAEP